MHPNPQQSAFIAASDGSSNGDFMVYQVELLMVHQVVIVVLIILCQLIIICSSKGNNNDFGEYCSDNGLMDEEFLIQLKKQTEFAKDPSRIIRFKKHIDEIVADSGDIEEAIRCVSEMDTSFYNHEVVKRIISISFDYGNRERELTSQFLAKAVGDNVYHENIANNILNNPLRFYAINGWNDINITTGNEFSYPYHSGVMYCTSNSWKCVNKTISPTITPTTNKSPKQNNDTAYTPGAAMTTTTLFYYMYYSQRFAQRLADKSMKNIQNIPALSIKSIPNSESTINIESIASPISHSLNMPSSNSTQSVSSKSKKQSVVVYNTRMELVPINGNQSLDTESIDNTLKTNTHSPWNYFANANANSNQFHIQQQHYMTQLMAEQAPNIIINKQIKNNNINAPQLANPLPPLKTDIVIPMDQSNYNVLLQQMYPQYNNNTYNNNNTYSRGNYQTPVQGIYYKYISGWWVLYGDVSGTWTYDGYYQICNIGMGIYFYDCSLVCIMDYVREYVLNQLH